MSWYNPFSWGTSADNSGLPGGSTDPVNNPSAMALDNALGTQAQVVTNPDGSQSVPMGKAGSIATSDLTLGNGGASLTGQVSAQMVYQQAMEQAAAAQGIAAPSQVNPQTVTAGQLNTGAYNVNTDTTAGVEDASLKQKSYEAAQAQASNAAINNLNKANVANVAAVPGADVAHVDTEIAAPVIGDAAQTGGTTVNGTTIDPLANQLRGSEIDAANNIANGPSAAESQFQAGQSQVIKDQLAMAAQARGADRAGARREAMLNAGSLGAQNNLSAAALAAQETQTKNVAAAQALSSIRGQDVTSATTQASLDSQQNQLQAQIDAATAQGNTAAVNTLKGQQATLQLQAQQSEVQAGLGQQQTLANNAQYNTGLQQQTALANATATNSANNAYSAAANSAYGTLAAGQNAASLANASATTGASAANANAYNTAVNQAAAAQNTANLNNAALAQSQAQSNANRALTSDSTTLAGQNAAGLANSSNSLTAQTTNAGNELNAQTLRNNALSNANSTAIAAANTQATIGAADKGVGVAQSAQQTQKEGSLIGAAGTVGAAVASDERAKTDLRPVGGGSAYAKQYGSELSSAYGLTPEASSPYGTVSDERAKQQVDRMDDKQIVDQAERFPLVTFRYKNGVEDGGAYAHLGTTAQGLEHAGPLGKMAVSEGPDGLKRVDYGALAYVTAKAALAKAGRKDAR